LEKKYYKNFSKKYGVTLVDHTQRMISKKYIRSFTRISFKKLMLLIMESKWQRTRIITLIQTSEQEFQDTIKLGMPLLRYVKMNNSRKQ